MKKSLKLSTSAVLFAAFCSATTPVLAQVTRELRVPIDSTSLRNTAGPGMVMPAPGISAAGAQALIDATPARQGCGSVILNSYMMKLIDPSNPSGGMFFFDGPHPINYYPRIFRSNPVSLSEVKSASPCNGVSLLRQRSAINFVLPPLCVSRSGGGEQGGGDGPDICSLPESVNVQVNGGLLNAGFDVVCPGGTFLQRLTGYIAVNKSIAGYMTGSTGQTVNVVGDGIDVHHTCISGG